MGTFCLIADGTHPRHDMGAGGRPFDARDLTDEKKLDPFSLGIRGDFTVINAAGG